MATVPRAKSRRLKLEELVGVTVAATASDVDDAAANTQAVTEVQPLPTNTSDGASSSAATENQGVGVGKTHKDTRFTLCGSCVIRLGLRAKNIHGLAVGSVAYKNLMKACLTVAAHEEATRKKSDNKFLSLPELLDKFESHVRGLSSGSSDARAAKNTRRSPAKFLRRF
jgi:hypothetical protein